LAERPGLPWYMGHDPELVAQPGPEGGRDPPVHAAAEADRSANSTAVTAIPRRHRKRTIGLTLKYHRIDRNVKLAVNDEARLTRIGRSLQGVGACLILLPAP
jgi:hypothetical protein